MGALNVKVTFRRPLTLAKDGERRPCKLRTSLFMRQAQQGVQDLLVLNRYLT